MELLLMYLELLGTAAFAVSGAITGLKKGMDIFGVCVLGLTTAVGGGIIRDIILGLTPPATFSDPKYALISVIISAIIFIPAVRKKLFSNRRLYDAVLLISDSIGLGVFTVHGGAIAMDAGYGANSFLVLFVAVVTGVGGGVVRDMFAGDRPYIFVKHIYACAAILGAAAFIFMAHMGLRGWGMLLGGCLIFALRILSAVFRWSLPKAEAVE